MDKGFHPNSLSVRVRVQVWSAVPSVTYIKDHITPLRCWRLGSQMTRARCVVMRKRALSVCAHCTPYTMFNDIPNLQMSFVNLKSELCHLIVMKVTMNMKLITINLRRSVHGVHFLGPYSTLIECSFKSHHLDLQFSMKLKLLSWWRFDILP